MSPESKTVPASSLPAALCRGIVDYAGTFPPAKLDLSEAAERYAAYRRGENAWMLHRFVVSAHDLDALAPKATAGAPWPISIVCRDARDVERVCDWHSDGAVVASIEIRESAPASALACDVFVERTLSQEDRELEALKARGAMLKIRLGGESVPPTSALARTVKTCSDVELPFKATAGLHRAMRTDSHGFLNLVLAAALARAGGELDELVALLDETEPDALTFEPTLVAWRHHRFDIPAIIDARRLFRSFGSCSFEEPVDSLAAMSFR